MTMRVQAWSIVFLAAVSAAPCFATGPAATDAARRLVEAADEAYAAGRVEEALALIERPMPYRPTASAL